MNKKTLLIGALLLVSATAFARTVQVDVDGLNCALCSAEMKKSLTSVAHADKVVTRLDCGKIYFEISEGAQLNEVGLRTTLLSQGFTMGDVHDLNAPLDSLEHAKC